MRLNFQWGIRIYYFWKKGYCTFLLFPVATAQCGGGGDDHEGGGGGGGGGSTLLIKGMVRKITDDISIRNGKYGDYIFYKTSEMKNPTFLKLKGFTEDYKTCSISSIIEWIQKTYKI